MFRWFTLCALVLGICVGMSEAAYASPHKETAKQVQSKDTSSQVNLNTADIEKLRTIKGVGKKKAQAVIDYRKEHGDFKSIDELTSVKGFSGKFLAKLQKNNPNRMILK